MKLKTVVTRRPQISLTPLIDVVFILLIFFMLVTKMTHYQSLDLYMSQKENLTIHTLDNQDVQISIMPGGQLVYQKQFYSLVSFSQAVPPETMSKLTIKIADRVTAQQFVEIKEQLLRLGYTNITEWVVPDED